MKQIQETQTKTAAAADPIDTPTVTHYDQLAAQTNATLADLLTPLGPLETPHAATRGFVSVNATVDDKFVVAMVAAVSENAELQGIPFDAARARDYLQMQTAFRPVADRLIALGRALHFTLDSRKAAVVSDALPVYSFVKRRVANRQGAALGPYFDVMQRALGRKRPKKKAAPQPPQQEQEPGTETKEVPKPQMSEPK